MKMDSGDRAIDKIYKRRDRYEIPDWQRDEVWNDDQRRLLIDSILRGWHLPKFYFQVLEDDPNYFYVVDGQQRLSAIYEFFDGTLRLGEESAKEFGGASYSDLPDRFQDQFDDYEIQYELIIRASDDDLAELFQRLQSGVSLNPDERLNATPGNLRDFCKELADHDFFTRVLPFADRRFSYFGILVRFAYLEIDGIPNTLREPQLRAFLQANRGFSVKSNAAKRISSACDLLSSAFESSAPSLRNKTVALTVLRLASWLVDRGKTVDAKLVAEFTEWFMNRLREEVEKGSGARDRDFVRFQQTISGNLTSGSVIREREQLFRKRFLLHHPPVASFDDYQDGTVDIDRDVSLLVDECSQLVHGINSTYARSDGEGRELFKSTNETVHSWTTIRKSIRNIQDYHGIIDALYFLVFEGTADGHRLGTPMPSFVGDVKDLRTAIRHDLDHGKSAEVRRQQRAIGATFRKYGAVGSPDLLPAEALKVVQVNLLEAFRSMLYSLRDQLAPGEAAS